MLILNDSTKVELFKLRGNVNYLTAEQSNRTRRS